MGFELTVDNGPMAGIDEVGELYTERWAQVRRLVRYAVRAPEPVIDEACQVAWSRLVDHRDRVGRATAVGWLVATAQREALAQVRRSARELSLDAILEQRGDIDVARRAPGPEEMVEARARLESVGRLPERQQRLVWLQALGLSYDEMAAGTGASRRTVERQILRARRTLRRADAARDALG